VQTLLIRRNARRRDFLHERRWIGNPAGIVQNGHDKHAVLRPKQHQMVAAVHHDLSDGVHSRLDHPLVNDPVGICPDLTFGQQKVILAREVNRNGIGRDEHINANGFLVLCPKLVHLVRIDDDVLPEGVFVARRDVFVLDFAVDWARFLIADAAFAFGMELV
jgi:hypothetical protein